MFNSNSDHAGTNHACPAERYLRREPEGLTVNGYRNWVAGYMTRNDEHWALCRQRFMSILGKHDGQLAANALGHLVRNLGNCATCPLRCYAPDSGHLNSDECMLLGLVAAIQHGDEDALQESVNALSCLSKCSQIIGPAGEYAIIMKSVGSLLLPIPASVLADIHNKSKQPTHVQNKTIH